MTSTAGQLFHDGRLDAAVAAAVDSVKQDPSAFAPRFLLAELLLFSGDLDRADGQLDAAASLSPQFMPQTIVIRRLLRAEQARRDFYAAGRAPRLLAAPNDDVERRLRAAIAIREGDTATAAEAFRGAERLRRSTVGICGELEFNDIRDLDDRLGSCLEVLSLAGDYCWVSLADVERLTFVPPKRPHDLFWRVATLCLRNGQELEVRLSAIYEGSHQHTDDQIRLGRMTTWLKDGDAYVRGLGQRMFLVGTQAVPILEMASLRAASCGTE